MTTIFCIFEFKIEHILIFNNLKNAFLTKNSGGKFIEEGVNGNIPVKFKVILWKNEENPDMPLESFNDDIVSQIRM